MVQVDTTTMVSRSYDHRPFILQSCDTLLDGVGPSFESVEPATQSVGIVRAGILRDKAGLAGERTFLAPLPTGDTSSRGDGFTSRLGLDAGITSSEQLGSLGDPAVFCLEDNELAADACLKCVGLTILQQTAALYERSPSGKQSAPPETVPGR